MPDALVSAWSSSTWVAPVVNDCTCADLTAFDWCCKNTAHDRPRSLSALSTTWSTGAHIVKTTTLTGGSSLSKYCTKWVTLLP